MRMANIAVIAEDTYVTFSQFILIEGFHISLEGRG